MQIAGEVIQLGLGAQGCSVTRCQLEAEGGQDGSRGRGWGEAWRLLSSVR